ncbi:MAG TPA: S8 family serine peptidase, partial [bacterium]|nr:S8 family serine peptidase [bacterium]
DYTVYNISESEYNDSLLFSQYIGDYGINSIINISGQIEDSNDFDVYKFRILKPSKISIKLSFDDITNSQTDFDFIVYRENIYFASAESSIEPEELTFIENFEYTEFAVKVYSYSEIGDYDLKLTISTSGYGSISGKLTPSSNYSINSNFSFKPKSKSAGELKSMAPGKFLCKYRNGDSSNNYKPSLSQKKYSLNAGNNLKISAIRDKKIFDNIFSGTFIIDGDDSDSSIFKASQPNTNRALDYKKNMSELLSVSEKFTKKLINILGNNNEFEYVEPDYIYGICSIPNDLYFKNQWNILNLNVPAAWNFSAGSDTIIIAVVDTGIKPEHPEFANRLVRGFDFISEISSSNDGDGIDANPDDSGDGISSSGNSYHGTHVAGIIASNSNNSQGISGISYNCKIMPLRALGKNGGLTSDIMEAVKFAAGLSNVSGIIPAVPAKIINMSLGGEYYSRSFEELLNTVNNMNITVVCAAGNENSQSVFYPAGYSSTISVAAVDYNNNKSFYSNYGGHIDISAPGGDMTADLNKDNFQDGIISAFWNETGNTPEYQLYQGTSQ